MADFKTSPAAFLMGLFSGIDKLIVEQVLLDQRRDLLLECFGQEDFPVCFQTVYQTVLPGMYQRFSILQSVRFSRHPTGY